MTCYYIVALVNRWGDDRYEKDFTDIFENYSDALHYFYDVQARVSGYLRAIKKENRDHIVNTSSNFRAKNRIRDQQDLQYEIVCSTRKLGVYLWRIDTIEEDKT